MAAAVAGLLWAWRCLCVFPWQPWNELRLEPSFLLVSGLSLYPSAGAGPVTTWIYGPITPLLLLPCTLAPNTASALLGAGAINLVLVLGTIAIACAFWPAMTATPVTRRERIVAAALCLAVWPASSLQYIQADNAAVAFGVLSNLLLVSGTRTLRQNSWFAALAAVVAIGCKQTAVTVLLAQGAWLILGDSWKAATRYLLCVALCGVVLGVAAIVRFGWDGLWLNLVEVPSHLPWAEVPAQRLCQLAPWLAVHLGVALVAMILAGRRMFERASALSLATFSWIAALPLGLAAVLKIGGTINSLHGLLYLLPPLVLAVPGWRTRERFVFARFGLALATLIIAGRLATTAPSVWKPVTAHLRQAEAIAAQLPGEVWFPWNPLVTYYRDHRFDHVEDGLYARAVSGHPLDERELRAHLPPQWSVTALLTHSTQWNLAIELSPANRSVSTLGSWTLYSWTPPAPPAR
jgi:hypothetical protein